MKRNVIAHVKLRPIERADIELLYKWNNENVLGQWQGREFVSLSEYTRRYDAGDFNSGTLQLLIVEARKPAGLFAIKFPRKGLAQFGISLDPAFRRQGIAYQALVLAVNYVFDNYQVERIEADTDIENDVAKRPLLKAGFRLEGVLRRYRYHHGKFHDAAMYSLIRDDAFGKHQNRKEVENGRSRE